SFTGAIVRRFARRRIAPAGQEQEGRRQGSSPPPSPPPPRRSRLRRQRRLLRLAARHLCVRIRRRHARLLSLPQAAWLLRLQGAPAVWHVVTAILQQSFVWPAAVIA